MSQLKISFHDAMIEKANELLDAVNLGMKDKDCFKAVDYLLMGGLYVFIAKNKSGLTVFNCLNEEGEIPKDFVVNWRSLGLVLHDIINKQK